jgi:hypothetical protein
MSEEAQTSEFAKERAGRAVAMPLLRPGFQPGDPLPSAMASEPAVAPPIPAKPTWLTRNGHLNLSGALTGFCAIMAIWGPVADKPNWIATGAACAGWFGGTAKSKQ